MEKVSQTLRQAREQRNMTLEDVAQRIHIPLSYLMALEGKGPDSRQRARLLPDPLYLIPHLRQYATFLDIDPNFAVTQFANDLQDTPERQGKTGGFHQSPQTLGPSPRRSRAISLSIVIAAVLVTLALIGQYSDLDTRAPNEGDDLTGVPSVSPFGAPPQVTPSPPATPPATSAKSPQAAPPPVRPSTTGQPSVSPSSAPTQTSGPAATDLAPSTTPQSGTKPSPPPTTAQPAGEPSHLLRAQAKEATWIRVLVEGQPPREMILQPGQSAAWTSNSTFLITLGNAGGVTLTVDGQELPLLGKSGQVLRNIRLPYSSTDTQG